MKQAPKQAPTVGAIQTRGRHVYLAVSCLEVDPATQRALNRPRAKAIATNFDPDLFGELVVSLRAARHNIVDGQHRVWALREMGWADQKVPCLLYEGLTLAEEARLWRGFQIRNSARSFDKFRMDLVAGNPEACDIERIVRSHGLTLSDQKRDGSISAVDALGRVYRGCGSYQASPAALSGALKLLKASFGLDANAFEGPLILGAGLVMHRYNGQLDASALAQKLAKAKGGPSGMIARAKALMETKRRTVGACVAAGIVDAYNAGRRASGKVEDWWASA